jgi:hypothetical protein
MEARDKKKVKLEFQGTSPRKAVAMKKPMVPAMVRPTILKVKEELHQLVYMPNERRCCNQGDFISDQGSC